MCDFIFTFCVFIFYLTFFIKTLAYININALLCEIKSIIKHLHAMQIEKVTLNQSEVDQIFNKCIELFDPQIAASTAQGHEINFSLNEDLEVWATLDLNVDYTEFDDNHQCSATGVTVKLFLDLFHNGMSVEGLGKTNLEDRIKDYNWIKYF